MQKKTKTQNREGRFQTGLQNLRLKKRLTMKEQVSPLNSNREVVDHQTAEENSTMKYRIVERKDIDKVLDVMKADYFEWTVTRNKLYYSENFNEEDALKGCEEFNKGLNVTEGSRYFRIVSNRHGQLHCVGFIVKEGHKKFKEGDLLHAASWAAPARNFARGNLYDDSFKTAGRVRWTGIG